MSAQTQVTQTVFETTVNQFHTSQTLFNYLFVVYFLLNTVFWIIQWRFNRHCWMNRHLWRNGFYERENHTTVEQV